MQLYRWTSHAQQLLSDHGHEPCTCSPLSHLNTLSYSYVISHYILKEHMKTWNRREEGVQQTVPACGLCNQSRHVAGTQE